MLEQLKYQNHLGEVFEFGRDGVYVNVNELHDYEWSVAKKNNMISSLDHAVVTRKLPVIIMCTTEAEGIAARNRLFEVVEKDAMAMQYGRIIIGDYYFRCYVTKSVKKKYLTMAHYMEVSAKIYDVYLKALNQGRFETACAEALILCCIIWIFQRIQFSCEKRFVVY